MIRTRARCRLIWIKLRPVMTAQNFRGAETAPRIQAMKATPVDSPFPEMVLNVHLPAARMIAEGTAGTQLQCHPRALTLPRMGRRMGDLAGQRRKFLLLPAGKRELRKRRVVVGRMHEFRLAVLADSDAGLRALDPT